MSEWKDGLPPVGSWCEYRPARPSLGIWEQVIFHGLTGSGQAIIEHKSGSADSVILDKSDFRPIISESDCKRDEAVDDLTRLISRQPYGDVAFHLSHEHAELIYESGYRKVKALSLSDIYNSAGKCCRGESLDSFIEGAKWARSQILGD